jgi:hypothetical protein
VSRFLQIMEMRTEAPELVGSLATLSDFYTDNSPAARRRLRSTIENQGVHINEQFLETAQSVIKVRMSHLTGLQLRWICSPKPEQDHVQSATLRSSAWLLSFFSLPDLQLCFSLVADARRCAG